MTGAPGLPSPAAGPGSWTGPLGQEIPLHLQLADLLVQAGDQGGVTLGLLVLTVAEDASGAIGEGLLPSLNLAGVDLVTGGQWATVSLPLTASRATLALKAGLCFLRPWTYPTPLWQQPLPSV